MNHLKVPVVCNAECVQGDTAAPTQPATENIPVDVSKSLSQPAACEKPAADVENPGISATTSVAATNSDSPASHGSGFPNGGMSPSVAKKPKIPGPPEPKVSSDLLTAVRYGGMYDNRETYQHAKVNLETFLKETLGPNTIVEFDENCAWVLDLDTHHWSIKPVDEELRLLLLGIYPCPNHWYISHGRGLKMIYTGPDAYIRCLMAALSVPKAFNVEIAQHFRHPASYSTKHNCTAGPVISIHNVHDKKWQLDSVGSPRKEDIETYLHSKGMKLGDRHDHSKCPICGDEPSDAGDCVIALANGIYCYRCAGKDNYFPGCNKSGYAPYSLLTGGSSTVLQRLVDYRVHWAQARYELMYEHQNIGEKLLEKLYRLALETKYGTTDPRVSMVFDPNIDVVSTTNGWVDSTMLRPTEIDNDTVDSLPSVLNFIPGKRPEDPPRLEVIRLRRSSNKFRVPNGVTPLHLYLGICLRPPKGTTPVRVPPHPRYDIQILCDPMPLNDAFDALVKSFPDLNRIYFFAALAAMICAEMGAGQPPALTVRGPAGSGKTVIPALAASFLGDEPISLQLGDDPEAFFRQLAASTLQGHRCIVLDEIGKIKSLYKKMSTILQVGARLTYRPLYSKSMLTASLRSAIFYTCVRFPEFLKNSPEFIRRTRGIRLPSKVPNWKETSGGNSADWRDRSKENAFVANSLLTHIFHMCQECNFTFDGSGDCVANRLGLGSISDGAEGINPEHLRDLYRYARGQRGQRVFIENNKSFGKGWLDVNASAIKDLMSVFANGDEQDAKDWKQSISANLEAVSWNDVLGIKNPPILIEFRPHGLVWGMRFRLDQPCLKGHEVLNDALPPIPSDCNAPVPPSDLVQQKPNEPSSPASPNIVQPSQMPPVPRIDNVLGQAGFPT